MIIKNCKPAQDDHKLPTTAKPKIITTPEIHPICSLPIQDNNQNLENVTNVAADDQNVGIIIA